MKIPKTPVSGQPVSPDWGREVCDALRRLQLSSGPGITLTKTPGGTTISSAKASIKSAKELVIGGGPIACRVSGGNSLEGYSVDLYENGINNSKSGTGILRLLEIAAVSTLPEGAWVLGHPNVITVTGGSE